MSIRGFLGKFFDPKVADRMSSELERSDPLAPAAPLVQDGTVSVIQTEKVGGHSWQQRQLREADQRLDAKAARAGARNRLNIVRMMADGRMGRDGTAAFGSAATHQTPEGEEFAGLPVQFTPGFDSSLDPGQKAQDEALRAEGDKIVEFDQFKRRDKDAPAHQVTSLVTPEEKASRIAKAEGKRGVIVGVNLHLMEGKTFEFIDNFLAEKLEEAGADTSVGTIEYQTLEYEHKRCAIWRP